MDNPDPPFFKQGLKTLFIGIGNVLRSDDGVGVYICRHLKSTEHINKIIVEASIENYIGKINAIKPDILVLIDCVNFNKNPGHFEILPVEEMKGITTSTHNISLNQILRLFKMQIWMIGVQPLNLTIGESLSDSVKKTADILIEILNNRIVNQ